MQEKKKSALWLIGVGTEMIKELGLADGDAVPSLVASPRDAVKSATKMGGGCPFKGGRRGGGRRRRRRRSRRRRTQRGGDHHVNQLLAHTITFGIFAIVLGLGTYGFWAVVSGILNNMFPLCTATLVDQVVNAVLGSFGEKAGFGKLAQPCARNQQVWTATINIIITALASWWGAAKVAEKNTKGGVWWNPVTMIQNLYWGIFGLVERMLAGMKVRRADVDEVLERHDNQGPPPPPPAGGGGGGSDVRSAAAALLRMRSVPQGGGRRRTRRRRSGRRRSNRRRGGRRARRRTRRRTSRRRRRRR